MHRPDFAIVDVETTGLFPQGHDRVLEIAIIRTDVRGSTLAEFATLVNPDRDLGPTHVHGIHARDLLEAPRFDEIVGDITALLDGAVFVAHNAAFDLGFVTAELDRARSPWSQSAHLCTLQLARRLTQGVPSRQLVQLCQHFDIPIQQTHSALDDARAAARLLQACAARLGNEAVMQTVVGNIDPRPFVAPGASCPQCRRDRSRPSEPAYIAQLVANLPAAGSDTPQLDEYYALLDRVLEDRRVTKDEVEALRELAQSLSLSGSQLHSAHKNYVRDLIRVALADDVITPAEQIDLDEVCHHLTITQEDYQGLLAEVDGGDATLTLERDLSGKTICFTGTMISRIGGQLVRRQFAEETAREHGMVVKKNVIKKLDYLVTADPDSMSGKAKKAREYGVRILAERVFWQLVGVDIE